jgi:hypothetical protein
MSEFHSTHPYFRPSLRLPASAVIWTMLCAFVSFPIACLYGWFNASLGANSHFILRFFAVCAYVGCLCALAWLAATVAKVRHPKGMGWLAIVIGSSGWYAQWSAYVGFSLGHDTASALPLNILLLAHPLGVLEAASTTAQNMIAEHSVLGTMRLISWLAEFMLMVLTPIAVGMGRAGDPYCERSNTWANLVPLPHLFACMNDPQAVVARLEADSGEIFSLLSNSLDDDLPYHWKVMLYHCPAGDIFVTVRRVDNKAVKGANLTNVPRILVDKLRLLTGELDDVKRKFEEAAKRVPTPPELLEGVAALGDERYADALSVAAQHVSSDRYSLRVDARRMCGFANAKLERWTDASQAYIALFDEEPTARNAAEVASCSVMAGDIDSGEIWIAKALEMNRVDRTVPGMSILTNYISALMRKGCMTVAMPYLEQVKQCYESLNSTDSTFLWIRGVPFFESFLEKSAVIVHATLDPARAREWYESMLPHVDQAGKDMVVELLRSWPEQSVDQEA